MFKRMLSLLLALMLAFCVPAMADEIPMENSDGEVVIEAPAEEAEAVKDEVAVEADDAIPDEAELPASGLEAAPTGEVAEALPEAVGTEEDPLADAAGEAPVETAEEAAANDAPISDEITPPAEAPAADDVVANSSSYNMALVIKGSTWLDEGQVITLKAGCAVTFTGVVFDTYNIEYADDQRTRWTLSDSSIASFKSVDGGERIAIIAKKPGTIKVTVKPTGGGASTYFKVKVIRNTLTVNKSAPMKKASSGRCTIAIKNIEIVNRGKVVINFYLMNKGFRKTRYIKNLKFNIKVKYKGKTYSFVNRTISRLNLECYRNKSKTFKVTFTGSQVKKATFNLKKLQSVSTSYSGTIYGSR